MLLLSVRRADTCIPVYIKGQKALSLLWLSDLTEIGSPMISRVNNDAPLGLTTGHWSTPPVTSLLTLLIIGLPTSVRAHTHINRDSEREGSDLCVYIYIYRPARHTLNNNACGFC